MSNFTAQECRASAADCRVMALQIDDPLQKRMALTLAQNWDELAESENPSDEGGVFFKRICPAFP